MIISENKQNKDFKKEKFHISSLFILNMRKLKNGEANTKKPFQMFIEN